MKKKYAVHPNLIFSKSDRQMHYIGVAQLVQLYRLKPNSYIVWDGERPETFMGKNPNDYIHLYPSYSGNYNLNGRR